MKLGLAKKVAVITGASEGIGKAIAVGLAREGAHIAISARNPEKLNTSCEEIKALGAEEVCFQGDMTNQATVNKFIDTVIEKWGTVHILVNNVGCATKKPFEEVSDDDWKYTIDMNIYSTVYCTRRVLPYMKAQRWGRVINISAVSGHEPSSGLFASNVAKSGVNSFTKSLANEVGKDNILVNCVAPGRILTPQVTRLFNDEQVQRIANDLIPMKRFGKPEEFANLVVFLASEAASYLNGTIIPVDGGISRSI